MVLDASIRLLHPFMPYITETIWGQVQTDREGRSIMFQNYSNDLDERTDEKATEEIDWVKAVVTSIRNIRSDMNMNPGERISAHFHTDNSEDLAYLKNNHQIIVELARLKSLDQLDASDLENLDDQDSVSALVNEFRIIVSVNESADFDEQIKRLTKDIDTQELQIKRSSSKLENEQFLSKAPAEIIEKEHTKLASCQTELAELLARRDKLTEMMNR